MTGMTKLSLENLQAANSDHLVQFGDDPGTSRIGCCKNAGQAHDAGTGKAAAAGISAPTAKRHDLMEKPFMLSALIEKKCFVYTLIILQTNTWSTL